MSLEPIALTTPLFYVNDRPHIGSAYPTIAADAFARFYRLKGHPVMFVTGTDEHGQKIQRTAEKNNLSPQEHCDRTVAEFYTLWEKFNICFDRFTRTTAPKHQAIVNEFFQRVYDSGDIYLNQQKGWYCVACEEFKEERELPESHHCPIHTNVVCEWRDEPNYFFRLSKYQDALDQFHEANPDFIQPDSRRNEVLGFMKQGLQDFSISRVNLDWGFPIPNDPTHTIYVWFDALLGYVTALLDPEDEPTLENALKKWYPFNLHIIGKDILRFHAIYWPAMLMSAGLSLPKRVFGHGLLTKDGLKMGKTLGNTIDPYDLVDRFGADAIRYYFLKEIEFGKDGDFNETRFVNILNADLANDLGNLLNRTLGMLNKYCQGKIENLTGENINQDNPIKQRGLELTQKVVSAYNNLHFNLGCDEILNLIRACNKYIDDSAPWKLYKEQKQEQVEQILYTVLESVRLCAYLLAPIIPNLSNAIYQQLGFEVDFNSKDHVKLTELFLNHSNWGKLPLNKDLPKAQPIFSRLEMPNQ